LPGIQNKVLAFMEQPLISCIVPVFNGELYIREALDSILAQTHRRLEIIVADDGSTDQTAEIVATFKETVVYLKQNHERPAAARNLGISAATGDFVAFLDADDLWHPEKLERQLARFRARPELDYCVTHAQNFWIPEMNAEAEKYQRHRISRPLPAYVTGTLMARRALFNTVGLFNSALAHGDSTDWFLRAAERGAIMEVLNDVLLFRRLHPANRSRVLARRSRDEFLRLLKLSLDRKRILARNS
jgi:glycosyltransferase involved in cell wall biosynthesis